MSEHPELNDELLCAYMDGELDPEMRVRVEQALLDDAGARVRLERMRVADERLKAEIPLPALEPGDPPSTHILDGQPMRVFRDQLCAGVRPWLRWRLASVV